MTGPGFSMLRSFQSSINRSHEKKLLQSCCSVIRTRIHITEPSHTEQTNESQCSRNSGNSNARIFCLGSVVGAQFSKPKHVSVVSSSLPNLRFQGTSHLFFVSSYRWYSSFFGGKDKSGGSDISEASGTSEVDVSDGSHVESEWIGKIKDVWQNVVDFTGHKANEKSDELSTYVQNLLDNDIIALCYTASAIMMAWVVIPRCLRFLHRYSSNVSLFGDQVPYDKSFLGALEDPIRYMLTFMAFCQM